MRLQGPLFRKYVLAFVAVICGMLIVRDLVELYISYRDNKDALVCLQKEKGIGAARIGVGAPDHRIEVQRGAELEMLADQFNNFAVPAEESYASLE
jgi:nitrate/nitrite-specific signal transduction histidine kinase